MNKNIINKHFFVALQYNSQKKKLNKKEVNITHVKHGDFLKISFFVKQNKNDDLKTESLKKNVFELCFWYKFVLKKDTFFNYQDFFLKQINHLLKYKNAIYKNNYIEHVTITIYRQTLLPLYYPNPDYKDPNIFYTVSYVCFQPKNKKYQFGTQKFDFLNNNIRKFLCFESKHCVKKNGSVIGFTFEMTNFLSFQKKEEAFVFDFFNCYKAPFNYGFQTNPIFLKPAFDKICFPLFDDSFSITFIEKKTKKNYMCDGNYFLYFQNLKTRSQFQLQNRKYIFQKQKWLNSLQNSNQTILEVLKKKIFFFLGLFRCSFFI